MGEPVSDELVRQLRSRFDPSLVKIKSKGDDEG
jgi:hypothetical protein